MTLMSVGGRTRMGLPSLSLDSLVLLNISGLKIALISFVALGFPFS
uniref:Uncharacterized protein n=1 Tax=Rhizophora mucronata TaxID=61149 RepID=A0A2P2Q4W1_RHIMU